jgi:adenylate cyclase
LRRLQIAFGLVAALLASVAFAGPWAAPLHGLSFDALVWLRLNVFGARHDAATSPTVVVAIDEETYRRHPFDSSPKVMWTRHLVPVIDALADAGATVIGFDVILPTTVAGLAQGYDTPFLQTLNRQARQGRLLLSKTQHSLRPILPAPGQRFAVGQGANIRSVNLFTDRDGIVRSVPLGFKSEAGAPELSFAVEMAHRALPQTLTFDGNGRLMRDGRVLPDNGDNRLVIDYDDTQAGIPTYSLTDVHACAAQGDADWFRAHFSGRVVLLGSVLDVEDRKLTSLRFATAPDAAAYADRCVHAPMSGLLDADIARDSLPGTYVHAFAINNLLRGDLLVFPGLWGTAFILLAFALAAIAGAMLLPVSLSAGLFPVVSAAWAAICTVAIQHLLALPLFEPVLAATFAFLLATGFRVSVTDRDKRLLRHMFGFYLAPAVIDRMAEHQEMPELGGETRELTVYFSDLQGFTALSEGLTPNALVTLLIEYLSAITDVIEAHGGFVDKYIGDAVVAVFGAPHRDDRHAAHAVQAALDAEAALAALNARLAGTGSPPLRQRIGISTGPAVVGNIGSRRRFNYTVTGDTVNLAARLESANKVYGTSILLAQTTAGDAGDAVLREVDTVRVVGRDEPVTLFQPLMGKGVDRSGYMAGLALYRAGEFATAARHWQALADADPTAVTMAARAERLANDPPPFWDGVYDLDTK